MGTLATHFSDAMIVDNFYYNCAEFIRYHATGGAYCAKDNVELTEYPFVDYDTGDFRIKATSELIELKRKAMSGTGYSYDSAGMDAVSLLPIVSDISPDVGAVGDTLTITGIFKTATGKSVTLGGISAAVVTESLTTITCTVPSGLVAGNTCDVVVTDPGAASCTSPNGFTLQAVFSTFVIRSVSKRYWDKDGGEQISIVVENGSADGHIVTCEGTPCTVVSESASLIVITTPALTAGTYDLTVQTSDGRNDTFTDAITAMNYGSDSPVGLFFKALETKLKTCTYITDSANVIVGESKDLFAHEDSNFPRIEVLCKVFNGSGYASQRSMDSRLRVIVVGYIKRTSDEVNFDDMVTLTNFGIELSALIYGLLDDKSNGLISVPGFLKFSGYPSAYYDFELIPKISTALLEVEVDFQLDDTQTR